MAEVLENKEIVVAEQRRLNQGVVIEPSPRWVRAYFEGIPVADSKRMLLTFEPRRLPTYWFPVQDVRMDLLTPARTATFSSSSSGTVRWNLQVGGRAAQNAAFSYPDPDPEREALRDHIAFYWKAMDAWFEEDDE